MTKEPYIDTLWTEGLIEEQALNDLTCYAQKLGKFFSPPAYPEEIAEALWGTKIEYSDDGFFKKYKPKALACFDMTRNVIMVNTSLNKTEGQTNFSIAHEVGHISLHGFLKRQERDDYAKWCYELSGDSGGRALERQADTYASALLMPTALFLAKVQEIKGQEVLNIQLHGGTLMTQFGVSRHALDIQLASMAIPFDGGRYQVRKKIEKLLDDIEEDRQSWIGQV